jgi:hypothetical protein
MLEMAGGPGWHLLNTALAKEHITVTIYLASGFVWFVVDFVSCFAILGAPPLGL